MSPEDKSENHDEEQDQPEVVETPIADYEAGKRSITVRGGVTRRQMVDDKRRVQMKSRPFILVAVVLLIGLLTLPVYAYFQNYVFPPRELALRVADTEYTRGDVVNFIRFNQRMSENLGVPFEIGNSLFDALQTLQENELAFQLAQREGISVTVEEVDKRLDTILGFVAVTVAERESREYKDNVEEAKRQFIHRIGMDESVFRDFIRKSMFKERLRAVVADKIPRVQAQVHVYQIIKLDRDPEDRRAIERDLVSGIPMENVVLQHSDDPNVRRNSGDLGWFPFGVTPEVDALLFGLDGDGNRLLPLRTPSDPRFDSDQNWWSYLVVAEVNDAREVNEVNFEALTTRGMTIFFNERRGDFDLHMVLDSAIFDWVNTQVRLSALIPTPTPVPFGYQGGVEARP
jgi:parvulin-like peptidyl-prolyl isomerase